MGMSYHIQRSFGGGEISRRMLMRQDHEYYKQSALEMLNFFPTIQGTAQRAPGTRYLQAIDPTLEIDWDYQGDSTSNAAAGEIVYDSTTSPDVLRIAYEDDAGTDQSGFLSTIQSGDTFTFGTWTATVQSTPTDDSGNSQFIVEVVLTGSAPSTGVETLTFLPDLDARIIPYFTTGNERSILIFTQGAVKLLRNVNDRIAEDTIGLSGDPGTGTITYRKQIIPNSSFRQGIEPWTVDPVEYPPTGGDGEENLGVYLDAYNAHALRMVPRLYKYSGEASTCTADIVCEVDVATDVATIDYHVDYLKNPGSSDKGSYTFNIVVSPNSDYSSPIYDETYTEQTHPNAYAAFNAGLENISLPSAGWTGTLYVRLTATAETSDDYEYSNPHFSVRYVDLWVNGEVELTEADLVTPYHADDLADLHFIQSPYGDKELVVTHPRHQPHKFYFDTGPGEYKFEPISFTNTPSEWSVNNYPATCGTYQGRLVLAGGQSFRVATGDPVAAVAETVWCTDVAQWAQFSTSTPVIPSDSLEFVATYRSPIQWVHGQQTLLIGALEFEYSAQAQQTGDGSTAAVIAPGDLGVLLHSTHGSRNIQPAAFGSGVLFASDAGTKVRRMTYFDEKQAWLADDMCLFNPEICFPSIRRMVRVRNPHQMCWVLKASGEIAVFHSESGIQGWSRYKINGGNIEDICVTPDDDGRDVVYMLVKRTVDGSKRMYLEAIPNFTYAEEWAYMDCHLRYNFETATDTITGLDHLEGRTVHVADKYRFLGSYTVESGQVVLDDDIGGTNSVVTCVVGLNHNSKLVTLPPQKLDPGSESRYIRFSVRVSGSTRPIINGTRPNDREPATPLGMSQGPDGLRDEHVPDTGYSPHKSIEISEHLPFRTEILGIYGKLEANSP